MNNNKKLCLFLVLFIVSNFVPFYIYINNIPIYIIWISNSILTMYLLTINNKKYMIWGILLSFIIESIHYYIWFCNKNDLKFIICEIIIVFFNIVDSYVISILINKRRKLIESNLNEIINITFFKVLPSILVLGLSIQYVYNYFFYGNLDFRFYNFVLSNFLGYVFSFTIYYIFIKIDEIKIKFSTNFYIFVVIIFLFNVQEVYYRNVFDMNRSHLEYISIFILVLSCILLKPEEFILLIMEDFIISFFMVNLFLGRLDGYLKEYLVSDLQLFYVVVLTTCFFLAILKNKNKDLIKEISIKNEKLKEEAKENKEMLQKVDILIDSIKNTAFIANENGDIIYSNNSFNKLIKENNIYSIECFKEALEELEKCKIKSIRKEIMIDDTYIMQEIFITRYMDKLFISGIGTDINRIKTVQEKLKKAKENAEEANKEKTSLLARISHELKTPMNTISGINYLLEETMLTKKQKEYTKKIDRASNLLLKMIDDILYVSKEKEAKLKTENRVISLKKVIDTVILIKEDEIDKKCIDFIKELDEDIPKKVIGDEFRLEQIFINLIGNSIKFTEKGYIKFTIKVIKRERNLCKVKFIVEDTGIGISKEKIEKIFEPFTQGDESITRKYGGTGLGLTICKNIVEELGGEIFVESKEGQGSKFNVILTLKEIFTETSNEKILIKKSSKMLIPKNLNENLLEKDIDFQEIKLYLDKLKLAIKNDVGEAIDIFDYIYRKLEKTEFEDDIVKIKKLMDEFDLEKAIEEVNNLENKF